MPERGGHGSLAGMTSSAPSRPAARPAPEPDRAPGRAGSSPPGGARTATARIEALDLARLLAILGMMAVHLLAPLALDPASTGIQGHLARAADALAAGSASTLFAVIGGCSLVLATRRPLARGECGRAVASVLVRGACVTLLGLVLELAPTSVMVVLVPFGLSMMLTAPLLLVPSRVLVPLLGVLALGGAPLAAAVPGPVEFGTVTLLSLDDPVGVLRGLVLTGQYPLITWVPYLLLGIVLMRGLLRAQQHGDPVRSSRQMLLAGAVTAAAGHALPLLAAALGHATPGAWYTAAPHTGTLGDMLATAGLSAAVLGALTWALPAGRQLQSRTARTLRAAGAAPLSIYVGHVLLTTAALLLAVVASGGELTSMPWYVAGVGVLGVHVVLTLALGAVLAARGGRGPLEALVARTVRRLTRV